MGDELDRCWRDILELERDASAALSKTRQRHGIVPLGSNMLIRDGGCASLHRGIEGLHLVAHPTGRDCGHPPELAATKNSNRATRHQRTFHGSALLPALLAGDRVIQHGLGLLRAELV